MAIRQLNLYADIENGRFVQSFDSTLQATLPKFVFGDTVPIAFRALIPSGNSTAPWVEADLTGQTVRVGIGNPGGLPESGSFTLTYGGDETSSLTWDATAAQVETALNLLASIIAAGGVTVTKQATGSYRVLFVDVGDRTSMLADVSSIYPTVGATIFPAINGTASVREVILIRLESEPASYAELTTALPSAAIAVSVVRAGSATVGEIQTLAFDVKPYGGTYTLLVGTDETTALAWDSTADEIRAALVALTGVGAGMATVTGEFPRYTVEFDVSLAAVGAMTYDASGLVVPVGRSGEISCNTPGFLELLGGRSQANGKFEVEIFDNSTSAVWTAVQADCTVIDDVIGNTPSAASNGPVYLSDLNLYEVTAAQERTVAEGNPGVVHFYSTVAITDFEDVPSPRLVLGDGLINSKPWYVQENYAGTSLTVDVEAQTADPPAWFCAWYLDGWFWCHCDASQVLYVAKSNNVENLEDAVFSAPTTGTGTPSISIDPVLAADFIGQLCRLGDATAYAWYVWDGTAWQLLSTPEVTETLTNKTIDAPILTGDAYFSGSGSGMPYGHMYANSTIPVVITDTTPVEVGDTWTTGFVNQMTFGASHYLQVTKAGAYKIEWHLSIAQNSPSASIQSEAGIMIDGVAQTKGVSHRTIANSVDIGSSCSNAILNLTAGQQISLYVANLTNSTNIDVDHGNLTVTMVGG